jgi:hypothetical protein
VGHRVARRFLLIRVGFWLGAAVTLLWWPIRDAVAQPPFRAWIGLGDWLFDTFAQWDSVWFLHIARHGYDLKGDWPPCSGGRCSRGSSAGSPAGRG